MSVDLTLQATCTPYKQSLCTISYAPIFDIYVNSWATIHKELRLEKTIFNDLFINMPTIVKGLTIPLTLEFQPPREASMGVAFIAGFC